MNLTNVIKNYLMETILLMLEFELQNLFVHEFIHFYFQSNFLNQNLSTKWRIFLDLFVKNFVYQKFHRLEKYHVFQIR